MNKSFLEESKERFFEKFPFMDFGLGRALIEPKDKLDIELFIESELKRFAEAAVNEMEKEKSIFGSGKFGTGDRYAIHNDATSKAQEIVKKLIS